MPRLVPDPPGRPLSPWQLLYGGAHALRAAWYRRHRRYLPRPVVSVGNLHWGGAGKTPLTAAIATRLRDRGLQVAILSRGHGRRDRAIRVVSSGDGPLLGPGLAGDEPLLLAGELPGVSVVVGPDRHAAGLAAMERLDPPPDLFLLDDGFSHLRLARHLDILALPAADPWGGGRLVPGGRLREPLAASRRAQAAVLTGAVGSEGDVLAAGLRPFGFRGRGFAARTVAQPPLTSQGAPLPSACRVLLVSAIARPQAFEDAAHLVDVEVVGALRFADHHPYDHPSIRRIEDERRRSGAEWLLTTSKDRVKLLGKLEAPLAELPIRCQPEPAFWDWLDSALEAIVSA